MLKFITSGSTAGAIFILALVIASGLYLGRFKVKGISLGSTWILFVGIILSHFGLRINPTMLSFIKDFGLILFVFAIGLQVGPGFFRSFRKDGLPMNILAIALVLLAALTAFGIHLITGEDLSIMTGIMSGAVTNTPGLGAAQQTISDATIASGGTVEAAAAASSKLASAYAVAYPLGVLGALFLLMVFRAICRVNIEKEKEKTKEEADPTNAFRIGCKVENPAVFGLTIHDIMGENNSDHLVVSRMMRDGEILFPDLHKPLQEGDKLLIVTDIQHKDKVGIIFGEAFPVDMKEWQTPGSKLVNRRLSITQSAITGKSLRKLDIRKKYGVNVTRILRSGIDLQADPDLILQVGDSIQVVGPEESINHLASLVGNQPESLRKPNLVPIFFGIAVGVIVGMIPIHLRTMPQPLKLGLAGGPLIVAILLGFFGPKLRITTYTALSANLMIREMGISLFMAGVGLGAGENFVSSLVGGGYIWVLYGAIITLLPMTIIAFVARFAFKMDFFKICGLLSGGTTDPALLSFSEQMYGSSRIAVNYATVYPLTMFLRVVAAQVLIMIML
ncbi:MAG: putative transporter [Bacteroidales bacterium]|nr:putative transporter [Bacteroidales bacterium]MBR0291993.1 putative transporter [Bacteroidales bacterium]